jgi:hypothetical protein
MPPAPDQVPDDDDDQIPTFLSQRAMTVISVVAVLALILGSASTVIALTDWGLDVAFIVGLATAALLTLIWFRMPKNGPRS